MKDRKKEFDESKITGFLDKDTEFKGDLILKGAFCIDGHYLGKVQSDSLLIVGDNGKVEADLNIRHLIVNGEVKGNIRASEKVEIHRQGRVIGTVVSPKLVVEEGAFLEANCQTSEAGLSFADSRQNNG